MTGAALDFLDQAARTAPIAHLGLAVSGGSDSTALLLLATDWVRERAQGAGAKLTCFTVDHGLRPEAAEEAREVARLCARLNIAHQTLRWTGWNGQGNLQDAARHGRYDALAKAALEAGCDAVALGHTRDDQAETFLLRLARGSGVDGLAAMRRDWQADGMRWLRPLLDERRAALRDVLQTRNVSWVEDPSNENPRFERVKMRQSMQDLAALGLDVDRLTATAATMATARAALSHLAHQAAHEICDVVAGDVVIDAERFWPLPQETRERILAEALRFVSTTRYRPRLASLRRSLSAARAGQGTTLQGCLILPHRTGLRVLREPAAVAGCVAAAGQLWDGRWRLAAPHHPGAEIRPLGEALSRFLNWRATGLPRQSLVTTPALWQGARLIAAPLVEKSDNCRVLSGPNLTDFLTSFLSH